MVYCGKPSKSCYPCRQKRTKCDLLLPSCTQCIRTGRICSGYRIRDALQIRDQSNDVVSRHAVPNENGLFEFPRAEGVLPQNLEISFELNLGPQRLTPCRPNQKSTIPPFLGFFQDDGPVYFFFNDYVVEDTHTPSNLFDLLPKMYKEASAESPLSITLKALGLACLSNTLRNPQFMMQANLLYAKMLNLTNSALRDQTKAKADQTLVIVMLLGLFEEVMINSASKSLDPWTNHVRGALALLDYRGLDQLQRKVSLHAIAMLRTQVVANCLIRRVEVPESILKWSKLAQEYEEKDENMAESDTTEIIAMFCNLQAAIDSPDSKMGPEEIISHAEALDAVLLEWAAKWQLRIPFQAITIPHKSPGIFTDHWHSYHNIQIATLWNYYRSIRIQVNQIIITYLSQASNQSQDHPPSDSSETQQNLRKRTILELSHEICASVPFFLNQNATDSTLRSAYQTKKTARARLLIWPLYVAGQSNFVSEIMRLWVADQMEYMGELMGIGKAKALAVLLRERKRTEARRWRDLGMDANFGFED